MRIEKPIWWKLINGTFPPQFSVDSLANWFEENVEPINKLLSALETALFRITQEALTNVSKHSNATKVKIKLQEEEKGISLVIADNGRGFNLNSNRRNGKEMGWGLINMRQRAESVGGQLSIVSSPEKGTQVSAFLPS